MLKYVGRFLVLFVFSMSHSLWAHKISINEDFLQFRYLEIDGSAEADCVHKTANSIDWDVTCKLGSRELKYSVHLVLSYYPATNEGFPAYELLYWISNTTGTTTLGDSVSQWIFLDSPQSKIKKMQTRLGIENDHSYLQMRLNLSR